MEEMFFFLSSVFASLFILSLPDPLRLLGEWESCHSSSWPLLGEEPVVRSRMYGTHTSLEPVP